MIISVIIALMKTFQKRSKKKRLRSPNINDKSQNKFSKKQETEHSSFDWTQLSRNEKTKKPLRNYLDKQI